MPALNTTDANEKPSINDPVVRKNPKQKAKRKRVAVKKCNRLGL